MSLLRVSSVAMKKNALLLHSAEYNDMVSQGRNELEFQQDKLFVP